MGNRKQRFWRSSDKKLAGRNPSGSPLSSFHSSASSASSASSPASRNQERPSFHIRWMLRQDMRYMWDNERYGSKYKLSNETIKAILRCQNTLGLVAEDSERVWGHALCSFEKEFLYLVHLVVHPERRRQGIGSAFIGLLKAKVRHRKLNFLRAQTSERWLGEQLFLRSCGMICKSTFEENGEVYFNFIWRRGWDDDCV